MAIAAYNPSVDISKTAVARALGGNRNTMRKLFSLQPFIYDQLNTQGKDVEEDEEETRELLERIEEEELGLGLGLGLGVNPNPNLTLQTLT